MSKLLMGFLMLCSATMMVLVLLIIMLSAALLIFARGDKKVKENIKTVMEPEKSTH